MRQATLLVDVREADRGGPMSTQQSKHFNPRTPQGVGLLDPRNSLRTDDTPLTRRQYSQVYRAAWAWLDRQPSNLATDEDDVFISLLDHAHVRALREGEAQFWEQLAVIRRALVDHGGATNHAPLPTHRAPEPVPHVPEPWCCSSRMTHTPASGGFPATCDCLTCGAQLIGGAS